MAMSVTYTTFNGMIVHENRGGIERAYVPDTLGSTQALIDDTETVTDTWEYWPYGEVSQRTGTSSTPFTFVGTLGYLKGLLDKLLYVRARYLRVDLARWLTVDPLWPNEESYEQTAFSTASLNAVSRGRCRGRKSSVSQGVNELFEGTASSWASFATTVSAECDTKFRFCKPQVR